MLQMIDLANEQIKERCNFTFDWIWFNVMIIEWKWIVIQENIYDYWEEFKQQ